MNHIPLQGLIKALRLADNDECANQLVVSNKNNPAKTITTFLTN